MLNLWDEVVLLYVSESYCLFFVVVVFLVFIMIKIWYVMFKSWFEVGYVFFLMVIGLLCFRDREFIVFCSCFIYFLFLFFCIVGVVNVSFISC